MFKLHVTLARNPAGSTHAPGRELLQFTSKAKPTPINSINCLLRIEPGNGRITMMETPPGAAISEPAHIASATPGHGGWLVMVIDIPNSPNPADYSSELWVVEADAVENGPVARVKTGLPLRSQVHGTWVSRARMDASVLK